MCFSPIASFTASGVLGTIGVATLQKVKSKQAWLFAAVPLLFAIQQFIEGLLWMSLLHHDWPHVQVWLILSYGIFAFMLWPVYMPVSLWLMEPSRRRKQFMGGITLVGLCFAAYMLNIMFHIHVAARISDSCILYEYPPLPHEWQVLPIYLIATCAAFCISSHRRIRWLGSVTVVAFLAAHFFYDSYLVSVWCFFAAIVSGLIYFYFHFSDKQDNAYPETRPK